MPTLLVLFGLQHNHLCYDLTNICLEHTHSVSIHLHAAEDYKNVICL